MDLEQGNVSGLTRQSYIRSLYFMFLPLGFLTTTTKMHFYSFISCFFVTRICFYACCSKLAARKLEQETEGTLARRPPPPNFKNRSAMRNAYFRV